MRKVITPATFAAVKRMNMQQLNAWAVSMYSSGFEDAKSQMLNGSDEAYIYTEEGLLKALCTVPGIGEKRARLAVNLICSEEVSASEKRNQEGRA